jgi:hypothetical protein
MPRGLKHKPGERYVAGDSQVLKWMAEKSGITDLDWLEAEFSRVRKFGTSPDDPKAVIIYDPKTAETIGILTYLAGS